LKIINVESVGIQEDSRNAHRLQNKYPPGLLVFFTQRDINRIRKTQVMRVGAMAVKTVLTWNCYDYMSTYSLNNICYIWKRKT